MGDNWMNDSFGNASEIADFHDLFGDMSLTNLVTLIEADNDAKARAVEAESRRRNFRMIDGGKSGGPKED